MLIGAARGVTSRHTDTPTLMAGRKPEQIEHYQWQAGNLGLSSTFSFVGSRPPGHIPPFIKLSDMSVIPRTGGKNTPLNTCSYLQLPTIWKAYSGQESALAYTDAECRCGPVDGAGCGCMRLRQNRNSRKPLVYRSTGFGGRAAFRAQPQLFHIHEKYGTDLADDDGRPVVVRDI